MSGQRTFLKHHQILTNRAPRHICRRKTFSIETFHSSSSSTSWSTNCSRISKLLHSRLGGSSRLLIIFYSDQIVRKKSSEQKQSKQKGTFWRISHYLPLRVYKPKYTIPSFNNQIKIPHKKNSNTYLFRVWFTKKYYPRFHLISRGMKLLPFHEVGRDFSFVRTQKCHSISPTIQIYEVLSERYYALLTAMTGSLVDLKYIDGIGRRATIDC